MAEAQINSITQNMRFLKAIDPLNARIIAECCRLGPNNLSSVARSLKIPIETVRYRFRKLRSIGVFRFDVFARYSKLGLTRCALFAAASETGENQSRAALSAVEYWRYLARCFGSYEGYYGVYVLPYANRADFEYYLREAEKNGVIKNYQAVFTGDPYSTTPNFGWFNFKKHFWIFPWEEWIKEAGSTSADSHHPILKDPQDYNSRLDFADIQILALLEADATRGLREIGRHLGFTASGVKYHWDNHVLAQGAVEGYRTVTSGFPLGFSDIFTFRFRCKDTGRLSQLVKFLSDKVFIVSFTKVLRANDLIAHVHIPKTEFERMMTFMYGIRQSGLIQEFSYVKLDLSGYSAETMSSRNYRNEYWSYDLDSQLKKLQLIVEGKVKPAQPRPQMGPGTPHGF